MFDKFWSIIYLQTFNIPLQMFIILLIIERLTDKINSLCYETHFLMIRQTA